MRRDINSRWRETVELPVPFHDLDPLNVLWFGNIYKYFDRARARLMKSVDYGTEEMEKSGYIWPIIESHCRHINFIEGETRVRVTAGIDEYDQRLKIGYMAVRVRDETRLATGYTVQIPVDSETGEMRLETPDVLRDRLDEAAP